MRNKFPGYCYKCGKYVPTGYGFFEHVNYLEYGKKWRVKCVKCTDGRKVKPTDREVIGAQKARDRWMKEHDAS